MTDTRTQELKLVDALEKYQGAYVSGAFGRTGRGSPQLTDAFKGASRALDEARGAATVFGHCENCGNSFSLGSVVLIYSDLWVHADCDHPYTLDIEPQEGAPEPAVLLGSMGKPYDLWSIMKEQAHNKLKSHTRAENEAREVKTRLGRESQ